MKLSEFKLTTINKLNHIIDEWFDGQTIQDRFLNGSLKTIIKAKQNSYDGIINMFADEEGNIDLSELKKQMEGVIPEKLEMDISQITSKWGVPKYLIPNKILLLTKTDIMDILKG